ncbi:MAG: DUF937 domain-containing protein [Leptospiraceae bacterium]|nr:DUF937 domain-containing protein [Leptospiraceae bacterium]
MGILDSILNEVTNASSKGSSNDSISNIAKVLMSSNNSSNERSGTALDLIMQGMKNQGLQDKLSSWIGTGSNESISENEITNVLGEEMIGKLSKETNLDNEELVKQLTAILPVVVDKLTPEGQLEEGGILSKGINLLKDFL